MRANPSQTPFYLVMDKNTTGDIYNYDYRLQNALHLIDSSEKICQRDKDLIHGFIEQLRAKEVSVGRRAKCAFALKVMVENLGVSVEAAHRKDIENLSILIQEREFAPGRRYTPHTRSDYVFAFKYFFKFVRFGNILNKKALLAKDCKLGFPFVQIYSDVQRSFLALHHIL